MYYDVHITAQLPATLIYRIFAESPEEAAEMTKNAHPNGVKYKLVGRKDIKLTVYDAGCSMIKLVKNLVGILR